MKFLGDNLRKFRTELGFSREQLAKKIKKENGKPITPRTIINWETDGKPDADSLYQMSQLFNKDLILFFTPITYQNVKVRVNGRSKSVRASKA